MPNYLLGIAILISLPAWCDMLQSYCDVLPCKTSRHTYIWVTKVTLNLEVKDLLVTRTKNKFQDSTTRIIRVRWEMPHNENGKICNGLRIIPTLDPVHLSPSHFLPGEELFVGLRAHPIHPLASLKPQLHKISPKWLITRTVLRIFKGHAHLRHPIKNIFSRIRRLLMREMTRGRDTLPLNGGVW